MGDGIKIQFIVATRECAENFWKNTATGRSLALYKSQHLNVILYPANQKGLSEIYNSAIDQYSGEPCIFVFAHDDLHILDFYWMHSILNGLNHFGVVGCAGNISRAPYQPSWAFKNLQLEWDEAKNLSGVVGHGSQFPPEDALSIFGPPFQQVKLLDGLFLAVFSETLRKNYLRFDEKFNFHFYDMDFCRQAEIRGVTMGTIPLSLIHESGGNFGTVSWRQGYETYIKKWGQ